MLLANTELLLSDYLSILDFKTGLVKSRINVRAEIFPTTRIVQIKSVFI